MSLKTEEIVQAFKQGGFRKAVIAVSVALFFAVLDQFTVRLVPWIAQTIEDYIYPPRFFISFAPPVDVAAGVRVSSLSDPAKVVAIDQDDKTVPVFTASAGRGTYRLQLDGTRDKIGKQLVVVKVINQSNDSWEVDTGERYWGDKKLLTAAGTGTRWSITDADFGVAASVSDPILRSMLANALAEVGVFEGGSNWERNRIASYFKAAGAGSMVNELQTNTDIPPWAGAFLVWVVAQAGASPPTGGLSFMSWKTWGEEVLGEPTPGMIVLFETSLPGRIQVGIFLRKNTDCNEAIFANVSQRVAISCVKRRVIGIRRPSSSAGADLQNN